MYVFCWPLLRLPADSGNSEVCNTCFIKSDIARLRGFDFSIIVAYFSRTAFFVFQVCYGARCHLLLVVGAKSGSWIDLGGNEHFVQQKCFSGFGNKSHELQGRGGPITTSGLQVSWVLVPLGPWSSERSRGILGTGHALRSKRGSG